MSAGAKRRRQRPTPRTRREKFTLCEKSGKRRYASKYVALSVAVRAAASGKQRAYLCPSCKGWHLTRSRA